MTSPEGDHGKNAPAKAQPLAVDVELLRHQKMFSPMKSGRLQLNAFYCTSFS